LPLLNGMHAPFQLRKSTHDQFGSDANPVVDLVSPNRSPGSVKCPLSTSRKLTDV
jgi:hypothetical protein